MSTVLPHTKSPSESTLHSLPCGLYFFWLGLVAHGILVPQGLNVLPWQWKCKSPNHRTARDFPPVAFKDTDRAVSHSSLKPPDGSVSKVPHTHHSDRSTWHLTLAHTTLTPFRSRQALGPLLACWPRIHKGPPTGRSLPWLLSTERSLLPLIFINSAWLCWSRLNPSCLLSAAFPDHPRSCPLDTYLMARTH